jgi:hypothetical protein
METKELVNKTVKPIANTYGKQDHSEGYLAKMIEEQTAKLPSDIFLWVGLGCLAASAIVRIFSNNAGQFIGQLASPVLIMGLYDKIVKTHGHDRKTKV